MLAAVPNNPSASRSLPLLQLDSVSQERSTGQHSEIYEICLKCTLTMSAMQAVAVVQRAMRQADPAEVMADLGFGPVELVASFPVSMSGQRTFTVSYCKVSSTVLPWQVSGAILCCAVLCCVARDSRMGGSSSQSACPVTTTLFCTNLLCSVIRRCALPYCGALHSMIELLASVLVKTSGEHTDFPCYNAVLSCDAWCCGADASSRSVRQVRTPPCCLLFAALMLL